jgi:serine protease
MRKIRVATFLALLLIPYLGFVQGNSDLHSKRKAFQLQEGLGAEDYWQGKVIFKIKEQFRNRCTENQVLLPELEVYTRELQVSGVHKSFPRSTPPSEPTNALGERLADLSLIYELDYTLPIGIEDAVNLLIETGIVDYAEPSYVYKPMYDPNDPDTGSQYYLNLIHAREAWDISKGDTNVVIGIIDTGCSYFHPDYAPKIKYNWADPADGIDNDNNGYVDDYRGWDFGGDIWGSFGDSSAQWAGNTSGSDHGVLVGGAAAAFTDNGLNVAAIGFNCKLLPVKVSINESPLIYRGYQGIVYAADNGADIMNLSWGGGGSECRMCAEAIRYASINKGVLVVAAAGNTPTYINFYPASYPEVLSVPGTQINDAYWSSNPNFGSTYSYFADVCAPSRDILTTTTDTGTYSATGTSLGAPIVCGIAGLVREHFPNLNMRQVGQMVRMGADENVYALNSNARPEQMGKGRSDALGALTYVGPAVRAVEVLYDTDDNLLNPGDTVEVRVRFANFLEPVNNLQITLTTPNFGDLEIIHGSAYAGNVGTLDTVSTWVCPFKVVIRSTAAVGVLSYLRFGYSGNGYTDYEYYGIKVEPAYITLDANRIGTSFDGRGRWGYTTFPALNRGVGFMVDGVGSLMNDGGFLVGKDASHVSNNIENQSGGGDVHFTNMNPIRKTNGGAVADVEGNATFSDAGAGGNAIGLTVDQRSYQWSMGSEDDYLIQEYTIKNTSGTPQNGLYAGMYFDLDGFWRTQNRSHYDPISRAIYNMDTTWVSLWDIGVSLLTPDSLRGFACNTTTFGYTLADKWAALTSPPQGAELGPANVAQFAGAGPFNIAAGDSHVVAFAILLGDSLAGMRSARQAAYDKYWCVVRGGMNPQTNLGADIINCGNAAPVTLDAGTGFSSYLWNTGATSQTITANSGEYWVKTTNGTGCEDYDRISVTLDPGINPSFTTNPSQVFVGDTVTFTSTTTNAIEWCWNWGDGSTECPITPIAVHAFTQPGVYNVCLTAGNGVCMDSTCFTLTVDTVVGVQNPGFIGELEVYPIPARDILRIRLENSQLGTVQIDLHDLTGRKLLEKSALKEQPILDEFLEVGGLSAGMYVLTVKDMTGQISRRIIVD